MTSLLRLGLLGLTLIFLSFPAHPARKQPVDTILLGDYLVTMTAPGQVIRDGAVAVQAGRIVAVGTRDEVLASYRSKRVIAGKDRILLPGLINGHTHMAMTLLRGLADDLDLMTWLREFIFPAEVGFVDEAFVRVGTDLACWEMLAGGTTTAVDMYYFPDEVAESLEHCGMRGIVAATVIGQESPDARTPEEGLAKAVAFIKRWQGRNSRITPALGPHAIYTTAPETLLKVRDAAEALAAPVSMHVSESQSEIDFAVQNHGATTIQLLEDIGFLPLKVKLIGAHVVWPAETEMALLHRFNVGAVHNPTSNMKIAAGVSPVMELQAAGVAVGLGTDGAASNNDLDMWEEMRLATLLQKVTRDDPTALPALKVLQMATIEGARAIGMEAEIGSVEVGKRADLIQVSLAASHMRPVYDVISHLVYVADSQDVTTVMVDGALLVREKKFTQLDTAAIQNEVADFQREIRRVIIDKTPE